MARVWSFLQQLFWIPKLDRRAQQTNDRFFRLLAWYARFALWFALIGFPLLACFVIINGDYFTLVLLPFEMLLWPVLMRFVIRMNVHMNGRTLDEVDQRQQG